jgi:hypothetical protein
VNAFGGFGRHALEYHATRNASPRRPG